MSERLNKIFERRVSGAALELRETAAEPTKIVGYAAVFNLPANGEVIRPGAFSKSIGEGVDVRGYWQHCSEFPLGRVSNGTLFLAEDGRGLRFELTPNPDTSWGRDALASVKRGDVTGMSFRFSVVEAHEEVVDGVALRVLELVDLYEVSPVSEPWYEATEAGVRERENTDPPSPKTATARHAGHGHARTHTDGEGENTDEHGHARTGTDAETARAAAAIRDRLRRLGVAVARARASGFGKKV